MLAICFKRFVFSIFICACSGAILAEPTSTLVRYSFDEPNPVSGPDTFSIFQNAKGQVSLSPSYRYSGYYSVEIKDVAGDRDFPELQGYFPLQDNGSLYLRFAFMTTNAQELFNIALAGPKWFRLTQDGIGFWLKNNKGYLYHYSDSIPKRLFLLQEFVWYLVDVVYNIDKGIYDLVIREEGRPNPIIELYNQKNATNKPGSRVDKFSFIGDRGEDTSNVIYYVDDVIVSTDKKVHLAPFVAPGRRLLFIDIYNGYQLDKRTTLRCLLALEPADFAASHQDLRQMHRSGQLNDFLQLLADPNRSQRGVQYSHPIVNAVAHWRSGCLALDQGKAKQAYKEFYKANSLLPESKMIKISVVLALAQLGHWAEVDQQIAGIYTDWQDDPRFAIAQAMLGMARGGFAEAEQILRAPAELIPSRLPDDYLRKIWGEKLDKFLLEQGMRTHPLDWQKLLKDRLLAEQYYYVLLWQGGYAEAEQYASRMINQLRALGLKAASWHERSGDAFFFLKDYGNALQRYLTGLKDRPRSASILSKISDVYFYLGDMQQERIYREKIYGSLHTANY